MSGIANKAEDGSHPVMTTLLLKLLPFAAIQFAT